jgi:hypothetical protein
MENTTSNWVPDNENTTFIKNKAENNQLNKNSLFNKQKLNETLLRALPPERASIGARDLEVMINSLIDKKLNIIETEPKPPTPDTTSTLNTSATTKANIYIKFKNWLSKVHNSPQSSANEASNCHSGGLATLCLG